MVSTVEWAKSLGNSVEDNPPPLVLEDDDFPRTAREIAIRAVILQGVVTVAYDVEPGPIIEWFLDQDIWEAVTPHEKTFLLLPQRSERECIRRTWQTEAEWTLLWMVNKVEALGLPDHKCDTRRLVDEIIPPLGSDIEPFLASAERRPVPILRAEDFRTYDLWCEVAQHRRKNIPLPHDLEYHVLYQRRYAFEWLCGPDEWDHVSCDA